MIDQAAVVRRILAHLGLATEPLKKPEDPVWLPKKSTLRGPPDELFPPDLDDAGLPVEVDGVDEEPGEPFFDQLPAEDWAALLGGRSVCWLAEPCADRADEPELM